MQSNKHVGRVTNAPKFEYVGNGQQLAKITIGLAIDRGNRKDAPTDFLYYTAMDKRAEILNSLNIEKGTVIEIDFIQESHSFTRQDGSRGYGTQNAIQSFRIWSTKAKENKPYNDGNKGSYNNVQTQNQDVPGDFNPFGIDGFDPSNLQ